ncbi:MAG: DUF1294 domain-containing protein [Gemmataceae bacterium]
MIMALEIYAGLLFILSLVTFALYGFDKWRASHQGWRIPEATLQTLAFLGGWPGAFLGQQFFRHKTRKQPFQILFWSLVVLHLLIVASISYACWTTRESAH